MKANECERSFPFLRINEREPKPRKRGLTEIRGPYYSVIGRRYLEDLFETMGAYVDSLKFAGGSFTLMPERAVQDIIELATNMRFSFPQAVLLSAFLCKAMMPSASTLPDAKSSGSISSRSQLGSSRFRLTIGCG